MAAAASVGTSLPGDVASAPYDPATEQDQLIRDRVTRDAVTGDAVFRSVDYPVGAVILNLQGATDGGADVLRLFPGSAPDDLRAAQRFRALHAEEVEDYLK
jgi:hypothetical protein